MTHPALELSPEQRKDQVQRISTLPGKERARIARSETLCPQAQARLANDSWASVRKALAENPHLLRTIQLTLAGDSLHSVKRHLARHQPNLHPETEVELTRINDTSIFIELVHNSGALQDITIARLATCGRQDVLYQIIFHRTDTTPRSRRLAYKFHTRWRGSTGDITRSLRRQWIIRGGERDTTTPGFDEERLIEMLDDGDREDTRSLLNWKGIPEHILQEYAWCSHIPEKIGEWALGHPRRSDILDLAPTWNRGYLELVEMIDLTAR